MTPGKAEGGAEVEIRGTEIGRQLEEGRLPIRRPRIFIPGQLFCQVLSLDLLNRSNCVKGPNKNHPNRSYAGSPAFEPCLRVSGLAQPEVSDEALQNAERHDRETDVPRETAGLRLPSVRMPPARMGQPCRLRSSGRTRLRYTIPQDAA